MLLHKWHPSCCRLATRTSCDIEIGRTPLYVDTNKINKIWSLIPPLKKKWERKRTEQLYLYDNFTKHSTRRSCRKLCYPAIKRACPSWSDMSTSKYCFSRIVLYKSIPMSWSSTNQSSLSHQKETHNNISGKLLT